MEYQPPLGGHRKTHKKLKGNCTLTASIDGLRRIPSGLGDIGVKWVVG